MPSTRLTSEQYIDYLHAEGERLLASAEGNLELATPTCEGWSVGDVIEHVGMVYGHKIAALEHGRHPQPGEWTGPPDNVDAVQWCHALLHRVAADLAALPSDAYAWTWWEPEQTAGFWQRRMAHETAVHRADVEAATGPITPVAADLALDGIDELLGVVLADAGVVDVDGPHAVGDAVRVTVAGVTVTGGASDLLLWLWGRLPDAVVVVSEGDAAALRNLLRDATQ